MNWPRSSRSATPLFGSTVASLNFSDLGLDRGGSGNLAFNYGLADGRTGVAMAVPGAGAPHDLSGNGFPVPDSVGISFVPVADFAGRNLTNANLVGADLRNGQRAQRQFHRRLPETCRPDQCGPAECQPEPSDCRRRPANRSEL